ncbi:unnamed protein product [Vicia faba]|uniref:Uncharacterized protein n=1 Tax=Vicia faba TaxID=3906 RepID=A0AAV1B3E8_VICFA|nr:unnamed protein product [Vicia faba]
MADSSSINNEVENNIPENTLPPKQEQKGVMVILIQSKSPLFDSMGRTTFGCLNLSRCISEAERVWNDLDLFSTYKWKSTEDVKHHQQTIEEGRIFQFLASLNEYLDEVRRRIIGRATLPSLGEIFAEVRREETRRSVMIGKEKVDPNPPKANALIVDVVAFKSSNQRKSSNL